MSYSPYQSPQAESHPSKLVNSPNRENLRQVAKYQRWVMYSLLATLATNILFGAQPHRRPPSGSSF